LKNFMAFKSCNKSCIISVTSSCPSGYRLGLPPLFIPFTPGAETHQGYMPASPHDSPIPGTSEAM